MQNQIPSVQAHTGKTPVGVAFGFSGEYGVLEAYWPQMIQGEQFRRRDGSVLQDYCYFSGYSISQEAVHSCWAATVCE